MEGLRRCLLQLQADTCKQLDDTQAEISRLTLRLEQFRPSSFGLNTPLRWLLANRLRTKKLQLIDLTYKADQCNEALLKLSHGQVEAARSMYQSLIGTDLADLCLSDNPVYARIGADHLTQLGEPLREQHL
jgi:hypothetical protein